jgi:hypothetical protein
MTSHPSLLSLHYSNSTPFPLSHLLGGSWRSPRPSMQDFALHPLHSLSTTPSAQPVTSRARVTSQDPIWQCPLNPTPPSMFIFANVCRRAPKLARGVESTPGRPILPTSSPLPPLCNPTLPRDQIDQSAALSRRSDRVPCTPRAPRAGLAFPAMCDCNRIMTSMDQQGTKTPPPSDTLFEP